MDGGSAGARGRRAREEALELARRSREASERARRWTDASEEERRVAATLLTLTADGWRLLVDRTWPGTPSADAPMILVGRGGVFVVDVVNRPVPPSVENGRLTGHDDDLARMAALARAVEERTAALGMSPVAVQPLMIFAGHRLDEQLARVRLVGREDVVNVLMAAPRRLNAPMVKAVAAHLEEGFPGVESCALPERRPDAGAGAGEAESLFDVEEVEKAVLESVLHGPIEQWMTFLHPDQVAIARRDWSGPARISGPAGTGKTVVGLHRAVHIATRTTGPIMYVTFVNNLPRVQGRLFQRMAGHLADRVEFTSLHGWAQRFLTDRGIRVNLDRRQVEDAFSRAWLQVGRGSALTEIDPLPHYWEQEIDHVIKGRGLTTAEEYLAVSRYGRRTPLQAAHREAVWRLYEAYELLRRRRDVHDFNDVLLLALRELRERPVSPSYAAVIVDEVQDLTLIGVRLLHALAGDRPNGLLLIGDGQQAVYPGGFRLAEAGVGIKGRGAVLRINYRNAAPILDEALRLVSEDPFDDLDGPTPNGHRTVETTYHEGRVVHAAARSEADHDEHLVKALTARAEDDADALSGTAVLCRSRNDVEHYHRLLTRAGLPVLRLDGYDGRPADALKIGTYLRSKGLEFKNVYLPAFNARPVVPGGDPTADERAALTRRQTFVAMTRARDVLWLGTINPER
ncbi:UvrD-helicase domain-containing protein [Actinomadura harenae]|uniref:UvrD-helicase domain-containing protein n=1 Tax=Actinomadura harenae TaxID=2483351 RepID=UPI001F2535E8|nr:UvrD-helicase domain-containing protein [Actinomadura harenae]